MNSYQGQLVERLLEIEYERLLAKAARERDQKEIAERQVKITDGFLNLVLGECD